MRGHVVTDIVLGTLAAAWLVVGLTAQTGGSPPPPVLSESLAGRDTFQMYCAPCHGTNGRGDGPVAPALTSMPSDLTLLAQRNGGVFPTQQVRAFVLGAARPVAAHGSAEMPVWGTLFRAFESDARVRERLDNLVEYLERLQQRGAE